MKKNFLLIVLAFALLSCGKDDGETVLQFKAEVLSEGPECQAHLIRFLEDIETVSQISGDLSDTYYAGSLSPALAVPGNQLRLNFRLPVGGEESICVVPNPSFPLLIILDAQLEQ